jgi:predicted SAM-dependent methyltransferase
MNEVAKTRAIWSWVELDILAQPKGIDIGYGGSLVMPNARGFDIQDGDANHITRYVKDQYDYVFSSHCLEHLVDPYEALREWWQLVRPGGYMFIIVPDEDLYEQGHWPSIYNNDHKHTFTISKAKSWSPVSINMLGLQMLDSELKSLVLQDHGYQRRLLNVDQTRDMGALAQIQLVLRKQS